MADARSERAWNQSLVPPREQGDLDDIDALCSLEDNDVGMSEPALFNISCDDRSTREVLLRLHDHGPVELSVCSLRLKLPNGKDSILHNVAARISVECMTMKNAIRRDLLSQNQRAGPRMEMVEESWDLLHHFSCFLDSKGDVWDGAGEGKSAGIHGLQVPEYASTSPMRISIEVLEAGSGSGSGSGVVGSGGERYEMVGSALVELDVLLATPGRTRWMPFVPAATMREQARGWESSVAAQGAEGCFTPTRLSLEGTGGSLDIVRDSPRVLNVLGENFMKDGASSGSLLVSVTPISVSSAPWLTKHYLRRSLASPHIKARLDASPGMVDRWKKMAHLTFSDLVKALVRRGLFVPTNAKGDLAPSKALQYRMHQSTVEQMDESQKRRLEERGGAKERGCGLGAVYLKALSIDHRPRMSKSKSMVSLSGESEISKGSTSVNNMGVSVELFKPPRAVDTFSMMLTSPTSRIPGGAGGLKRTSTYGASHLSQVAVEAAAAMRARNPSGRRDSNNGRDPSSLVTSLTLDSGTLLQYLEKGVGPWQSSERMIKPEFPSSPRGSPSPELSPGGTPKRSFASPGRAERKRSIEGMPAGVGEAGRETWTSGEAPRTLPLQGQSKEGKSEGLSPSSRRRQLMRSQSMRVSAYKSLQVDGDALLQTSNSQRRSRGLVSAGHSPAMSPMVKRSSPGAHTAKHISGGGSSFGKTFNRSSSMNAKTAGAGAASGGSRESYTIDPSFGASPGIMPSSGRVSDLSEAPTIPRSSQGRQGRLSNSYSWYESEAGGGLSRRGSNGKSEGAGRPDSARGLAGSNASDNTGGGKMPGVSRDSLVSLERAYLTDDSLERTGTHTISGDRWATSPRGEGHVVTKNNVVQVEVPMQGDNPAFSGHPHSPAGGGHARDSPGPSGGGGGLMDWILRKVHNLRKGGAGSSAGGAGRGGCGPGLWGGSRKSSSGWKATAPPTIMFKVEGQDRKGPERAVDFRLDYKT